MSSEAKLLSAICKNKDISTVLETDSQHLFNSHEDVWNELRSYYFKHKAVPEASFLGEQFADFEPVEVSGGTKFYLDELRDNHIKGKLKGAILNVGHQLGEISGAEALEKLQKEISVISRHADVVRDLDITNYEEAEEFYKARRERSKEMGGSPGIPTGIRAIDAFYPTGMAPGHLIVLLGWSGRGKSFFAAYLAAKAWSAGFSPMIVSLEMSPEEMRDRVYTILGSGLFSNTAFNKGTIDVDRFHRWAKDSLEDKQKFVIVSSEGSDSVTPNTVQAKIDQHRPDLVICHEKGTKIYDGEWMNVEEHPTARERICDGYEINVSGIPYSEVVTPEHRYWVWSREHGRRWIDGKTRHVRDARSSGPGWKEAQSLVPGRDWIGYRIDTSVRPLQPIPHKYQPESRFGGDPTTIIGEHSRIPRMFHDPEFWWFVGRWWGDGNINQNSVEISFAEGDTGGIKKAKEFAEKYGRSPSFKPYDGQVKFRFTYSVLARWLSTWRTGNSLKVPPGWVEYIDYDYQEQLIKGYFEADGYRGRSATISSICLEGLESLRRISSRIGITTSIYKTTDGHFREFPSGITSWCKPSYVGVLRGNLSRIGLGSTSTLGATDISGGYLWSRVAGIVPAEDRVFVPIQTDTQKYQTSFGLSHNCDYHQLFDSDESAGNETVRNRNISREFKLLAVRNGIPVVDLSQATQKDSSDTSQPPLIEEVAWSRGIQHDANLAIAVHKHDDGQLFVVLARKNRHGPLFEFALDWDFDSGNIKEIYGD